MAPGMRRMLFVTILLIGVSRVGWTADTASSCPAIREMPYQVRLSNCQLAKAFAGGMARSATFRRLVVRVGELKGIVYVTLRPFVQPGTARRFAGALRHRTSKAGDYRLLYVVVAPGPRDRPLVILAHELQHAIEVLESPAADDEAIDRLFARIGVEASAYAFETDAALDAQYAVERELSARTRRE